MPPVRHRQRQYKQMALEVAVRNPERYDEILKTYNKFRGIVLDDNGALEVFTQLYIDGVITANQLDISTASRKEVGLFIKNNISHKSDGGYPEGWQAAFYRYLRTLSEFGFIYAQYNEPLRLSEVADAVISNKITLSEAFALQCMRFWRKSPYRRVLNDFNYFKFVIDVIKERNDKGHRLSYPQFMISLFSDDGDIDSFVNLIEGNKVGNNLDKTYALIVEKFHKIDDKHGKVVAQNSAFNDYGNTVFRVLQLTGFITVDYQSVIMLSINSNRWKFYQELSALNFCIDETAKDDKNVYFNTLGTLTPEILKCIYANRDTQKRSIDSYNEKLSKIVNTYNLDENLLATYLKEVSQGANDRRDFWFMQIPLKFEFLLSLYLYVCLGEDFDYKPNYICDDAGIPYSHAPGNIGDIEVFNNDFYWLIEATLIKSKNQQINSETINLFRHIDEERPCTKYLSLIAPYIHEDTDLLIKVATVVSMLEQQSLIFSKPYSTEDYIAQMSARNCINDMQNNTMELVGKLGKMLTRMSDTFNLIQQ